MGHVNRLSTASETGQSFTYAYDRQGNRWGTLPTCTPSSSTTCQYTFSGNKITNAGITYDLAGNVTYDGFHSYTYDFEGRILKVDGGTTTYSYNALGQRVAKIVSGTEGDFVLDQAGHAITGRISSPTHPWYLSEVYAGNMHVATYANGTTAFPHTNWMGTVMASTGPTGSTIKTCSGYLPFGDGSSCSGSDVSSLGFTGLWSDSETLLDNTPNRNYQSLAGRWTTPDPAGLAAVDVTNPQTWNRYTYVTNSPVSATDPLGLVDPRHRHGHWWNSEADSLSPYEGFGRDDSNQADCIVDGTEGQCGLLNSLLGNDALAALGQYFKINFLPGGQITTIADQPSGMDTSDPNFGYEDTDGNYVQPEIQLDTVTFAYSWDINQAKLNGPAQSQLPSIGAYHPPLAKIYATPPPVAPPDLFTAAQACSMASYFSGGGSAWATPAESSPSYLPVTDQYGSLVRSVPLNEGSSNEGGATVGGVAIIGGVTGCIGVARK